MDEKRGAIRHAAKASISFQAEGDNSKTIEGRLLNISHSGFSALLRESIDADTIIQFDLSALDFIREHLTGKGKIVRVAQQKTPGEYFIIGVKFIEHDKDTVLRFINTNKRIIWREEHDRIQRLKKKSPSGPVDYGAL